ncbi:MAG: RsmB/NOP family class I SAM-dependent RNA methyltransferase, partial [Planctomycetota bacterium JB042]
NGVLRTIDRETRRVEVALDRGGASARKRLDLSPERVAFFSKPVFIDPDESRALHLAQVHSMPVFLVERWLARHDPALVEAILEASNRKPPVTARIQRLKTNRDSLLRRLVAEGIEARAGILDESIQIDAAPMDIVRSSAFKEGLLYLQDEAAMKVAHAVEVKPGERILDLCAAPGGKATHLAELASGEAEVVAADRDLRRLERVKENVARLGLSSVVPVVWDPLGEERPPEEVRGTFDAVLLDVPCSNTGVLARRPEARWRVSVDAIRELADQGRRLLHEAVKSVRPGGKLVFSTCSLEEEENRDAVKRALVGNPKLTLVRQEETLPSPNGPDGGFFALFEVGGGGR